MYWSEPWFGRSTRFLVYPLSTKAALSRTVWSEEFWTREEVKGLLTQKKTKGESEAPPDMAIFGPIVMRNMDSCRVLNFAKESGSGCTLLDFRTDFGNKDCSWIKIRAIWVIILTPFEWIRSLYDRCYYINRSHGLFLKSIKSSGIRTKKKSKFASLETFVPLEKKTVLKCML